MTGDGPTIFVSQGTGTGRTELAAFDAALVDAGVGDFNLVRLSSVVPPGSRVVEVDRLDEHYGGHGDLLYCVYAEAHSVMPGHEAWAGIAWSLRDDGTGAGLFVEHEAPSREQLDLDLTLSIEDLSASRGNRYAPAGRRIVGVRCESLPVCSVVVAAYRREGWGGEGR
ncbi:pyruvoyl-dependent arginine decarboxylase [Cellulosimicrobium cellulans]|uniref:Pyruvoyl-dependent arginine decarboxylase AaxB n=1 Tax=Cellulosimicrobium cellulans TaxID=1710 RepID=A0A4Y4DYT9_CELCE|nr:pyruvoyl-dependent arginine decarboxylase [Cellulosimicrobium cellulans]GED10246.1 pyruvoyl-dependent arginine decarboxylase [Cellulosimicrobium cellulans]